MRSNHVAAFALTALMGLVACGGDEPQPQAPPPPPPPPVASTPAPPPADTTPPPPPKPTQAELIQQTMKSFGEAENGHDAAKLASLFAKDGVWTVYGDPDGTMQGADAIQKGVAAWMAMSSDSRGAPTRIFEKGNVVVAEVATTGTMTGDFMGMKATNKPYGVMDAMVVTLNDDGQITSIHDYFDGPTFMAQITGKKGAPPPVTLPTAGPEMHVAKGSPDEDKLVDWGNTFNDAFNKDAKTLNGLTASDGDVTFYFMGGKNMKGKELTPMNDTPFKAFPKGKWTVTNAWGVDGYVIQERTMGGAWKGRLGPMAPTGKDVTWHSLEIIQPSADGKLQHGWVYANMMEIAPPPPPKAAPAAKAKKKKK